MKRSELLESYLKGHEKIKKALLEIPAKMWDYKPAEDKWSVKEIVVHLADSEANAYVRCRKIVAESGSGITVYNRNLWAANLNYKQQNIEQALELFKCLRLTTYHLLRSLPEDKWRNFIIHPETGEITLEKWLMTYENHVSIHIEQMKKNYEDWIEKQKKKIG